KMRYTVGWFSMVGLLVMGPLTTSLLGRQIIVSAPNAGVKATVGTSRCSSPSSSSRRASRFGWRGLLGRFRQPRRLLSRSENNIAVLLCWGRPPLRELFRKPGLRLHYQALAPATQTEWGAMAVFCRMPPGEEKGTPYIVCKQIYCVPFSVSTAGKMTD